MHKRVSKHTENIEFHLAQLMREKGFTKNKLCVMCGLRFETIQGYYNGDISRVDLFVLSQLCHVLNCNIQDIIEYVPENAKNETVVQ